MQKYIKQDKLGKYFSFYVCNSEIWFPLLDWLFSLQKEVGRRDRVL